MKLSQRTKLLVALACAVLLVGAAYAAISYHPSTKVVLQFQQGCLITDSAGISDTNVTVTYFGVSPLVNTTVSQNYMVVNASNQTRDLTGINATDDNGAVTTSILQNGVVPSFPIVLASTAGTPFTLLLTVTPAALGDTNTTVTITANCA